MNNEPVAWMRENEVWEGKYNFSKEKPPAYPNAIPLYTHPVKELTEDMLWELAEKHLDTDDTWGESNVTGIGDFIEAILRKAQEK